MKVQQSYIVDLARTPVAKVNKDGISAYSQMHPVDQVAQLIRKLADRNGLDSSSIDDIKWGATTFIREQGICMARMAAIVAFGEKVPGEIVGRLGASGLNAIVSAINETASGCNSLEIAGGSEDMSLIPLGTDAVPDAKTIADLTKAIDVIPRSYLEKYGFKTTLESAETIAKKWNISREEQDKYAYDSHFRANNAWKNKVFCKEVIPINTPQHGIFSEDDGIRADTTLEKLAKLKPIFNNGTVTPGNSSPFSIGASATIIANEDAISKHGLKPRAKLIGYAVCGSDVDEQLTGPISAIPKALEKAGLKLKDIDLFQIGEAFASEVLAIQKELDIPYNGINVNGGALSIGHPPGATGVNIVVTGLHELERRAQAGEPNNKYLLATVCVGFGQGVAAVFERVS